MTRALLLLLLVAAAPRLARAHDVRGEIVLVDVGDRVLGVEIQVPVRQLEIARQRDLAPDPAAAIARQHADLVGYAQALVGATSRDGRAFHVTVRDVSLQRIGDGDVVDFQLELAAPDGASARWFALRDDLVLGRVTSATAYVFVRHDDAIDVGPRPQLLGYLHYQQRTLEVDRPTSRHGYLWLLFALLPAPFLVGRLRWPVA